MTLIIYLQVLTLYCKTINDYSNWDTSALFGLIVWICHLIYHRKKQGVEDEDE